MRAREHSDGCAVNISIKSIVSKRLQYTFLCRFYLTTWGNEIKEIEVSQITRKSECFNFLICRWTQNGVRDHLRQDCFIKEFTARLVS